MGRSFITIKPSQIFDGPDQEQPLVAAAAACAIIPVSRQSGDIWDGGAPGRGPKLRFLVDCAKEDAKPSPRQNN
jgi:hypothetical protein